MLRASASRLATFCIWRRSVRLSRYSITDCYIRYSPTGGVSKSLKGSRVSMGMAGLSSCSHIYYYERLFNEHIASFDLDLAPLESASDV
jgi:hypothetical protein